jgi:epoxyqueuosine reductase
VSHPARALARAALALLGGTRRRALQADGVRFEITLRASGPARTLRVDAPRNVLEVEWRAKRPLRVMAFSRGTWERALARLAGSAQPAPAGGRSWMRPPGRADALLARMMAERGLRTVPLARRAPAQRIVDAHRPAQLAAERDGPVTAPPSAADAGEHAHRVKELAREAGAAAAGIARLRPGFVALGQRLEHGWAIAVVVAEDYRDVLGGAAAVQRGAHRAYARCAEIATALARQIRERLGHAARAHHIGAGELQMVPLLHAAGIGELGRHGSLINPALGASFRAAAVSTTLPLVADAPLAFGVQDYCLQCRACERACPGDAIAPASDHIVTGGVRRWLVDTEKCYPYSRLREEYCHICVDVCPYVHKENRDPEKRSLYKQYTARRGRSAA